jgi:inner membrane protein
MPFSDRWFYGDALFIIDVWLWAALGVGVWLSRRRRRTGGAHAGRPALAAVLLVSLYAGAMGLASLAAERAVARTLVAEGQGAPARVLASPVPINPLARDIVYEQDGAYGFGEVSFLPGPRVSLEPGLVATHMGDPVILRAAAQSKAVADFLYWARWPFAEITRRPGVADVVLLDARYSRGLTGGRLAARATVAEPPP